MSVSKIKLCVSGLGVAFAFALSNVALAGVVGVSVDDIKTEADCTAQEGIIVDAEKGKTCWAPLIPVEFQTIAYAAKLKGVDSCAEADIETTEKVGQYCKILLSSAEIPKAEPLPLLMDTMKKAAQDETKKEGDQKAKK